MDHFKAVIMGLLLLGVVVGEIEAKPCCLSPEGLDCFKDCGGLIPCEAQCGCFDFYTDKCPEGMVGSIGTPSNDMTSYCKLGCTSSVCGRITAGFRNGVSGEKEAKKAVEHCNNACSRLCDIKGSKLELAAAA